MSNWFRAEDLSDRSGDILVPFNHRWRTSFELDRIRAIFRRRVPASFRPRHLFVYVGSPEKVLLGYCEINELKKVALHEAEQYLEQACIDRNELEEYFRGYKGIGLYVVGSLNKLYSPLRLDELKEKTGFIPPQSFVALSHRASSFLFQRARRRQ